MGWGEKLKITEAVERIKTKGLSSLVVVSGDEPFFLAELRTAIRSAVSSEACVWEEPVLGKKVKDPLGVLWQVDIRMPRRIVWMDPAKSCSEKDIERYCEDPPKKTTLVLVYEDEVPSSLSRKGLLVDCAPISKKSGVLEEWVMERAAALNLKLSESGLRSLISIVGADLFAVVTELEKLAILFAGREPSVSDISRLVVSPDSVASGVLFTALERKDRQFLLSMLRDGGTEGVAGFLGALVSYVERMILVRSVASESEKDVAQTLGKSYFLVKMDMARSKKYGPAALIKAHKACAEVDKLMRSGGMADKALAEVVEILCV